MPDNRFWRDASNRLTFEMSDVPARCYADVLKDVVVVFGLVRANEMVIGLDVIFQNYRRDDSIVGLAWDNWTGFTVVAMDQPSEDLFHEIAAYLSSSRWATIHLSQPEVS